MIKTECSTQEKVEKKRDMLGPNLRALEACMNPWNKRCSNTDISLYIMYRDQYLPICQKCWQIISVRDFEWMCD